MTIATSITTALASFKIAPTLTGETSEPAKCNLEYNRELMQACSQQFPISYPHEINVAETYWVTNEYGSEVFPSVNVLLSIDALENLPEVTPYKQAAVVVGESGLLAGLPELYKQVDVIFMVDINPVLLLFYQLIFREIHDVRDINDSRLLLEQALSTAIMQHQTTTFQESYEQMLKSMECYQERVSSRHCFVSPTRLEQTQSALRKLDVIPVQLNFFNREQVQQLGALLNRFSIDIRYINVSNIFDEPYICTKDFKLSRGITEFLQFLPISDNAVCAHSRLRPPFCSFYSIGKLWLDELKDTHFISLSETYRALGLGSRQTISKFEMIAVLVVHIGKCPKVHLELIKKLILCVTNTDLKDSKNKEIATAIVMHFNGYDNLNDQEKKVLKYGQELVSLFN